jgi:hypothetical protein
MFDNERYITKGLDYSTHEEIKLILWNFIDLMKLDKGVKIDYLQVFRLRKIEANPSFNQVIIHSQEQPSYRRIYFLSVSNPVNSKIYVIDDSVKSIMMLAEEY